MRSSRQTVQSAEIGGETLNALARLAPSAALIEIGDDLAMPVAKVHRYLKALIASGLAEQDADSGHYRLGPECLQIGLAALDRVDVVAIASQYLPALCETMRSSCFIVIWGNRGPTVVRVAAVASAVTVVTRVGTVLPLLGSATGLVFAAYIDRLDVLPRKTWNDCGSRPSGTARSWTRASPTFESRAKRPSMACSCPVSIRSPCRCSGWADWWSRC